MMGAQLDRKRWSELASVGVVIAAGTVLFFEILRSQLPEYLQAAIDQSTSVAVLAFVSAIGLSMLCAGVGVISVSGMRLFIALRKADHEKVRALANDHLGSVLIVALGFACSAACLYLLSQVKP
jgi:uncharacterized membrane protein YqhA